MTERYEHRRAGDRELLGWLRPEGDDYVAIDLLGRELTGPVDWPTAEDALDAHGLRWLSDLWQLRLEDGSLERVRIVEVRVDDRVVVKRDDLGAVGAEQVVHVLPFPAPAALQPFAGDPHLLD